MKPRSRSKLAVLRGKLAFELPADRTPPEAFRLFAAGKNETEKGTFLFDETAAEAVMAAFSEKGLSELPIDYEHQMLEPTTAKKLAAGWFVPEVRDGELWAAQIRWTPAAAEHLSSGEYRYYSPAFVHEEETGRIVRLINFALTNTPAMNAIDALVAASARMTEDRPMDYEKMCSELKQTVDQLSAENQKLRDRLKEKDEEESTEELGAAVGLSARAGKGALRTEVTNLATLRSRMHAVTGEKSDAAALGKIEAWKSEAGEASVLRAEKEKLETETLSRQLNDIFATAFKEGKIAEKSPRRESLEKAVRAFGGGKISAEGIEWLRAQVDELPAVKMEPTNPPPIAPVALTEQQKKIAVLSGWTIEERQKLALEQRR